MVGTAAEDRDIPGLLQAHFEGHDPVNHGSRWDLLWQKNITPWDRGQPSPALVEVLQKKQDITGGCFVTNPDGGKRRKRALVPGMGRGYDVLLLSAFGYDAYGLEISENALEAAKEYERLNGNDDVYKAMTEEGKGRVVWISGDFFKDEFVKEIGRQEKFDLLFDYTFLSALPPSLRPLWSRRMVELLAPSGILICLEWPSLKDQKLGGPPWALPPTIYLAHLQQPGQELEYDKSGILQEENLGSVADDGLERLEHFHPAKSHGVGMTADGKVDDFVSIWKHKSPV